jgi:hypothetical protein
MTNARDNYITIPTDDTVKKTVAALEANNFIVEIVQDAAEAKQKALALLPQGAEVMVATSETLRETGIEHEINESGDYDPVKLKLAEMDRETQGRQMQRLGAAAEYQIGSVHAITQDGHLLIASNSGSQLPGLAYGSDHVILVVGAHKIVTDVTAGIERINEYILPLESERARKAYGLPEDWNSAVSKLLIYNREPNKGRVTIIIVKEVLGF